MPYIGKSPSAGVRQRYQYTATAGQTTFSGTDLGNLTLTYTDNNFVDVFQNGVLLKGGGTDYTATSGTSVVLATGASVSDVIEIIVYDVFSVGNFFNRTDSDSRYVNVDGDTMTGTLTLSGAVAVTGDYSSTTSGTSNLRLGVNAGNSIASGGNYNVCIGDEAGTALTTGDENTAVGFESLATEDAHGENTAIGYRALKALNAGANGYNVAVGARCGIVMTTGTKNTGVGSYSLNTLSTGSNNTAVGQGALNADTKGNKSVAIGVDSLTNQNFTSSTDSHNTAVGNEAGNDVTTGRFNNIFGSQAADTLTTGSSNVAMGYEALTADTQGSNSVAVGDQALASQNFTSATDSNNTAVGALAGKGCTTGEKNTFIGALAGGDSTQTGDSNVAVGYAAGFNLTSGGNNILIGKQAGRSGSPSGQIDTESNTVCLGDDNITDLFCADSSISTSDSRDKTDITDFSIGLNWLKDLRPVTYKWDKRSWYGTEEKPLGTPDGSKKGAKVNVGFVAQEVLKVEKANGFGDSADTMLTCNITEDGQRYGMKYERLIPILVNAIKELSSKNDALEARIKKLEDG